MNTTGKRKRRPLTAEEHRKRAQKYRRLATHHLQAKSRQELMLAAIKHEVIADELVQLEESGAPL
jgi:hypothetical protein